MARPKLSAEKRLDHIIRARVTMIEHVQIEHAAAAHGLSMSDFVRRRSLGYRLPPMAAKMKRVALASTALLRLGVNLNQIAKHANAGQGVAVGELNALIVRINAEMDKLTGDLDDEDFDSDENV